MNKVKKKAQAKEAHPRCLPNLILLDAVPQIRSGLV
jgi:hypothetical protein